MNEDEAFIRAIVDTPGDDTPRLVYADWLDDLSDPRGPYLRAEHEWAATHDPSEHETLRQLAKKLDPVWVARVSRPPVGVCLDHVRFTKSGPHLESNEIPIAQQLLRRVFPSSYQAFLTNHNGGMPIPLKSGRQNVVGEGLTPLEIHRFYRILPIQDVIRVGSKSVEDFVWLRQWTLNAEWLLPIARAGGKHGVLYIATMGDNIGRLLYQDDAIQNNFYLTEIASDLPTLFNMFSSLSNS